MLQERNHMTEGMELVYYNSWDQSCKQPFGASQAGETIDFTVYRTHPGVRAVYLQVHKDYGAYEEVKLTQSEERFSGSYQLNQGAGLYFYSFRIEVTLDGQDHQFFLGNHADELGGVGQLYVLNEEVRKYQITAVERDDLAPDWFRQGVVYHIFVDRFFNGTDDGRILSPKRDAVIYTEGAERPHYIKNEAGEIVRWDFYGGNLLGIIKKLPYLQELGVTILYLSPIFEARSNHKYDTADFLKIDPMFGDEETFQQLIDHADEFGMKIILDGVFNHTGFDSRYFNGEGTYETVGAYQSTESPYYEWYDFSQHPDEFESWWGIKDLPTLNSDLPSVREFIFEGAESVVRTWSQKGLGGWRIDVADELSDQFLAGLRQALEESALDQPVLIGEVWEDATNKIAYGKRREYILGDMLHGVMNYPFTDIIIDFLTGELSAHSTVKALMNLKENYPAAMLHSNLNNISTHDSVRIKTALGEATELVKLAFSLMFVLPGVPTIYYGDEAGLSGEEDPDNRRPYPWGREDISLRDEVREWAHRRTNLSALSEGEFVPFALGDCLGVLRYQNAEEWVLLVLNPTDVEQDLIFSELESFAHQFTADGLESIAPTAQVPPKRAILYIS